MNKTQQGRPVIFGEVLFDSFPDGSVVMGGAPLNVAWHLQGFGLEPLLISRVGNDDYGKQVIDTLNVWGMDVAGIQIDNEHPTGKVAVSLQDGQPQFSILADQAYDFIATESVQRAVADNPVGLFYHGSLAARNPVSRQALETLRHSGAPLFVDINLRAPWWERAQILELMRGADWLKLNDVEFRELDGKQPDNVACRKFIDDHQIGHLILTLGENGARIISEDAESDGRPVQVENIVDTVGAGDAFSSIMMLGILSGWEMNRTMTRALEFAARVCSLRGATIADRNMYGEFITQWDNA